MTSDENVTWSEEETEKWEHDEWLRMEAMGDEAYSFTKAWEEQEEKKRRIEEGEEEEEEMWEEPYEKEERLRWKEEEEKAREAYFKEIKEEEEAYFKEIKEEEEAREACFKEIREEEKEEEEEESHFVDVPTLRPPDSSTLGPSDSSTDIDISSQESKLDNSQAVVESLRAEGDECPRAEGAESPRAEGAEPAEAGDGGPQVCDTGQIRNGCLREEEVRRRKEKRRRRKRRRNEERSPIWGWTNPKAAMDLEKDVVLALEEDVAQEEGPWGRRHFGEKGKRIYSGRAGRRGA